MATRLTKRDEGKVVTAGDGERIGVVAAVRGEEVWIDPDAEILHELTERTDWNVTDRDDTVELQPEMIAEVTDDEVRLTDALSGE